MRIELYGLQFETRQASFHLWSPWRAAEIEHRLFQAVRAAVKAQPETGPDEWRMQISDPKDWRSALQAVARVLKGWQEEAEPGGERRAWRWLLEGDCDADGYDHTGERFSLWCFMRLSLERGGLDDGDKSEDVDLQGFGVRIHGQAAS